MPITVGSRLLDRQCSISMSTKIFPSACLRSHRGVGRIIGYVHGAFILPQKCLLAEVLSAPVFRQTLFSGSVTVTNSQPPEPILPSTRKAEKSTKNENFTEIQFNKLRQKLIWNSQNSSEKIL